MLRHATLLLVLAAAIPAEEVVREIKLGQLVVGEGALPAADAAWDASIAGAEVFSDGQGADRVLLVRAAAVSDLKGVLAVYGDPGKPAARVSFTIPAKILAAATPGEARFATAMRGWCDSQLNASEMARSLLPEGGDRGARAWWALQRARASGSGEAGEARQGRTARELDKTIDLFTGATALNENLQFDRTLRVRGEAGAEVDVATLPELTVKEIPWQRMAGADAKPELDPLAARIPGDQHAILFPSFAALADGLARVDSLLTGPLQAATGRADDAGAMGRYQHQLGLELTELSKRFGGQVVDQVALTGSDPFLRAGTDVAILLKAKQPALLAAYLTARLDALAALPGTSRCEGDAGAAHWRGVMDGRRTVSAFVLVDGDTVLVTNSQWQLSRYQAVAAGTVPALAAAPEYAFFRRRYARGTAGELALAVVPDAALRRWCSARWRIADSRRMRAAQLIATLQAEWIAAGAKPDWKPAAPPEDLGTVMVDRDGVLSSRYGTTAFLTPVSELAVTTVSQAEAEAYRRFHDRYQSRWRDWFDPIALRITAGADGALGLDLSILPLIVGSEYRQMLDAVGGATLQAGAGDLHRAAVQFAIALDHDSGPLAELDRDAGRSLGGLAAPFSWVGNTASVYADDDPFWQELAALADGSERGHFIQANLSRLPIGINIAVADPLKLAAFLTAVRAMASQSAPGLVTWGTATYKEVEYVVVTPSAQGAGMLGAADAHLCYLAAPEGLTLTTSTAVMQRAIDRLVAARAAPKGQAPAWPGSQCALAADPAALRVMASLAGEDGVRGWMQRRSWANLAILNEWHRLFPGQDPVAVHERLWGVRPVCPGGGTYVWNERWLTMESTAFGNPGEPKPGPELPAGLAGVGRFTAGLGFEALPGAAAGADGVEPAGEGEKAYTVQRGDTLTSIARANGSSVQLIIRRNGLSDNRVQPGQKLVIPPPGSELPRHASEAGSYGLRVGITVEPKR